MKKTIKKTLIIALPIIIGNIAHVALSLIDTFMIGKLGAEYLAAASISHGLFILPFLFGIGITFAISPLIAIANGEKDTQKSAITLTNSFYITLVISLIIGAIIYFGAVVLFYLDQPEKVVNLALPYLKTLGLSAIPALMMMVYKQFSEGLEIMRPALIISILSIPANAFFNWLLIFGNWGFPRLELEGAGWATLITRILMFLMMMFYVMYNKRFAIYEPRNLSIKRLRKSIRQRFLKLGIPSGIQYVFEGGAFSCAVIMIGWLGANELAAHNIAITPAGLTFMIALGLSSGSAIRIGNAVGKNDFKAVREIGKTSLGMIGIFMLCCGIVFATLRYEIPEWFIEDDPETKKIVIELAAQVLLIVALFQLVDGIQAVCIGLLRGLEDVKIPTTITLIAYWIIGIPMAYVLAFYFNYGLNGIWIGLFLGMIFAAVFLTWRFFKFTKSSSDEL